MNYEQVIERFILDELSISRDQIDPDEQLIATGVIDSVGLLRLVNFIEETLGASVDDEDVVAENLGSIANISRFMAEKAKDGRVT